MSEPRWINREALLVLHDHSIVLHGGRPGLRDSGLLESALERPANRFRYDGLNDIPALAALYLAAIAGNHPFVDGNKRAAFLAAGLFLELNGWRLAANPADAASLVFAVAAGSVGEAEVAAWIVANASAI